MCVGLGKEEELVLFSYFSELVVLTTIYVNLLSKNKVYLNSVLIRTFLLLALLFVLRYLSFFKVFCVSDNYADFFPIKINASSRHAEKSGP